MHINQPFFLDDFLAISKENAKKNKDGGIRDYDRKSYLFENLFLCISINIEGFCIK
jgi:hypothetical protein